MMTEAAAQVSAGDLRRLLAVMDFDGTITSSDCMDTLMRRHVAAWPALVAAVREGRLSQAAAFEEAVALLRIPREQVLREFADLAVLRAGFREFVDRLLGGGGRAAVVSVGFREAIESVWRREQLAVVPLYAGELLGDPAAAAAPPRPQRAQWTLTLTTPVYPRL